MILSSLDIEVTSKCNLRCKYCYLDKPEKDISTDELIKFIHKISRIKTIRSICLTGGEPFSNGDLDKIISAVSLYKINYSILSNGSLINNDIASIIQKTGMCSSVQVSVDGPDAATHDYFRGPGAFDGATRGIEILRSHDIPIDVRMTINKNNYLKIEETIRFILEDLKLEKVGTNSVNCIGACKNVFNEVSLTVSERSESIRAMLELVNKYGDRLEANAGPLAEGLWWKGHTSYGCGGYLTACGCVFDKLAVKSNGNIVPCVLLGDFVLGNINSDSLLTIFYRNKFLEKMRSRRSISLNEFEYCRECDFISECTGGCPASTYFESGFLDIPSTDGCRKRFLENGGIL